MAAAAAALARAASGEAAADRGAVRVTASEIVGVEVLPPMLAAFHAAHPGIAIELALTNRTQDLARRDADIAVRMVRPTQEALVAKKLGRIGLGLHAHRRYLDKHGMPLVPQPSDNKDDPLVDTAPETPKNIVTDHVSRTGPLL